jgi:hypothetical protein
MNHRATFRFDDHGGGLSGTFRTSEIGHFGPMRCVASQKANCARHDDGVALRQRQRGWTCYLVFIPQHALNARPVAPANCSPVPRRSGR